jgi:hypothetical protein
LVVLLFVLLLLLFVVLLQLLPPPVARQKERAGKTWKKKISIQGLHWSLLSPPPSPSLPSLQSPRSAAPVWLDMALKKNQKKNQKKGWAAR